MDIGKNERDLEIEGLGAVKVKLWLTGDDHQNILYYSASEADNNKLWNYALSLMFIAPVIKPEMVRDVPKEQLQSLAKDMIISLMIEKEFSEFIDNGLSEGDSFRKAVFETNERERLRILIPLSHRYGKINSHIEGLIKSFSSRQPEMDMLAAMSEKVAVFNQLSRQSEGILSSLKRSSHLKSLIDSTYPPAMTKGMERITSRLDDSLGSAMKNADRLAKMAISFSSEPPMIPEPIRYEPIKIDIPLSSLRDRRHETQIEMLRNLEELNEKMDQMKDALSDYDEPFLAIQEIDSFAQVIDIDLDETVPIRTEWAEKDIKEAFAEIIGEKYVDKDWGGERCDLFTTRVKFNGKMVPTAIMFKGKAVKGKLCLSDLGKNGDQMHRLFTEPAALFILQFIGPIDSYVLKEMKLLAKEAMKRGEQIYFAIIDGVDTYKILRAYKKTCDKCGQICLRDRPHRCGD